MKLKPAEITLTSTNIQDAFAELRQTLETVKGNREKYDLYSSDVSELHADNTSDIEPLNVKLRPLVAYAEAHKSDRQYGQRIEAIKDALFEIRFSAQTLSHPNEGRNTNALMNAVAANMTLLQKQGSPFHGHSKMEDMICRELEDAIRAMYARQVHDGQGLEIPFLLKNLASYGTYNPHKQYRKEARETVDYAFSRLVHDMVPDQRAKMDAYLNEKMDPKFARHVRHILGQDNAAPSSEAAPDLVMV